MQGKMSIYSVTRQDVLKAKGGEEEIASVWQDYGDDRQSRHNSHD